MAPTITAVPEGLLQRLRHYGQEHVLGWWDRLDPNERHCLLAQLEKLDLEQLQRLYAERGRTYVLPPPEKILPAPVTRLDATAANLRQVGEGALRRGELAVLVVAGGQATRLGTPFPKGMFPIGPVTSKTLFQIHAEKALALCRQFAAQIPFLVMTSPATDSETRTFIEQHQYFGLTKDQVHFFCQGTMPALDMATGKLLLEGPGRLFTSPNGHGGTLLALADSGLLEMLGRQGIRQIFYFQVDNPLVKIADPAFLGYHLANRAEVSSKVVAKDGPKDKLGNMVVVDGRCTIIEYSDLPEELASGTDKNGRLRIWAGSPAIHLFSLEFLERVVRGDEQMPFHTAKKKVPFLNEKGEIVHPESENAFKFEKFIFDVLPAADRWTAVETRREEEFVPLKNATGSDSPDTVRQAMSDLAADWLSQAGVKVPRRADGSAAVPLEISPLYARDAQELASKMDANLVIDGPTYIA